MKIYIDMYFNLDFSVVSAVGLGLMSLATIYILTFYVPRLRRAAKHRDNLERGSVMDEDSSLPGVSVIVHARENSHRLAASLPDLLAQQYPGPYEVIVVNDGGGDAVSDIVTRLSHSHANLRLTFVPENAHNLSRRKLSITLGVKASHYDYVVITSAECRVPSSRWLASMARHFAAGREVVLGTAVVKGDEGDLGFMARLDETANALTWLGRAIARRPYRGTGYNLGYSRELFFAHKGFSRTLNLHEGDDDLFINEISNGDNTAVELSSDSILTVMTSRPERLYRELKLKRCFTGSRLPSAPRRVVTMGSVMLLLSLMVGVAVGILAWPNLVPALAALLLILLQWIVTLLAWRRGSRALETKLPVVKLIPGLMWMPVRNLRYKIASRRESYLNYTWNKK